MTFLDNFLPRVYILSTLSKFDPPPPTSRKRQNSVYFWNWPPRRRPPLPAGLAMGLGTLYGVRGTLWVACKNRSCTHCFLHGKHHSYHLVILICVTICMVPSLTFCCLVNGCPVFSQCSQWWQLFTNGWHKIIIFLSTDILCVCVCEPYQITLMRKCIVYIFAERGKCVYFKWKCNILYFCSWVHRFLMSLQDKAMHTSGTCAWKVPTLMTEMYVLINQNSWALMNKSYQ